LAKQILMSKLSRFAKWLQTSFQRAQHAVL
jgi:hypothetical protein